MMKNKYNKWILISATVLTLTACGSSGGGTTDGANDSTDGGTNEPAKPTQNSMIHNGTRYGTVVSPKTGRVWLDRNLGAERVCTAYNDTRCYGDYYQWGRGYDGHQDPHSDTTETKSKSLEDPGYKFFNGIGDWLDFQRTEEAFEKYAKIRSETWRKTDGSSICPRGFRVPSLNELDDLRDEYTSGQNVREGMANTFLKLPAAGRRLYYNNKEAPVISAGEVARYPSYEYRDEGRSTKGLIFYESKNRLSNFYFPFGLTVRCIKAK